MSENRHGQRDVCTFRRKVVFAGALLPVLGLGFPATTFPQSTLWVPPQTVRLDYYLEGQWMGSISGAGSLDWTYSQQNKAYTMDVSVSAFLLSFFYSSRGHFDGAAGVLPDAYREKRIGRDRTVFFDYANKMLSYSWKSKSDTRLLEQGVQDAISVLMQMIYQTKSFFHEFRVGQSLTFPIARMGSVREWSFTVKERTTVEVRSKNYDAWRVRWVSPKKDEGTIVDLWLAPSIAYMPVLIHYQSIDGSDLIVQLSKVRALEV